MRNHVAKSYAMAWRDKEPDQPMDAEGSVSRQQLEGTRESMVAVDLKRFQIH